MKSWGMMRVQGRECRYAPEADIGGSSYSHTCTDRYAYLTVSGKNDRPDGVVCPDGRCIIFFSAPTQSRRRAFAGR